MKIDCIIKCGSLDPLDFAQNFNKIGKIIDVMSAADSSLARSKWCMQGETIQEAQSRTAYTVEGQPNMQALRELEYEYRGEKRSSIGIWLNEDRDDVGASISLGAFGGIFPDTVSIDVFGAFVDRNKASVADIVTRAALEFEPVLITAAPDGYWEKRAFDDRPGVGWMLYLPVELGAQQVPEAQELIPALSADGKKRLGTIVVSIRDEPFSTDNEVHLAIAHGIEARLVSLDLLPLFTDI